MPVTDNSKRFSCWSCKHFQAGEAQGVLDGSGECRALPPAACCTLGKEFEPIFPEILEGEDTWCSAWMQGRNIQVHP